MNTEAYDTMELDDAGYGFEHDEEQYDHGEVDDMLDALMESTNGNGLAERKRRQRGRAARRKGVPAAQGRSAYREPAAAAGGPVSQKQFKDALDRVGADIKRNAEGIKTINSRLNVLDGRVDGVVSVATVHSRGLAKLEKQMKIDGALELVQAFNGSSLDAYQLLKGAVKSGFLGDPKGAMGNPAVIGGLGMLLRNPNILSSLTTPRP